MSKVGIIEYDKLAIGLSLMENNTYLREWGCPLPSLTNGNRMFYSCEKLNSFNSDLSSLTHGGWMFYNCTALTSFTSNISSLTNGSAMFNSCSALTSFTSDLPRLTYGDWMFYNCTALTSFTSDSSGSPVNLSSLLYCIRMFKGCTALSSFTSDLPSLTNGEYMFTGCTALTSFNSDLSSLTNGEYMFTGCTALTSFNSDLPSLTDGDWMFDGCLLDAASIQHISDTINDLKSQGKTGKIHIGHAEDVLPIILYESAEKLTSKGWAVYLNGVEWKDYGPYDVVKRWGYIPDASKWNDDKYIKHNLIITEITTNGEMINNE